MKKTSVICLLLIFLISFSFNVYAVSPNNNDLSDIATEKVEDLNYELMELITEEIGEIDEEFAKIKGNLNIKAEKKLKKVKDKKEKEQLEYEYEVEYEELFNEHMMEIKNYLESKGLVSVGEEEEVVGIASIASDILVSQNAYASSAIPGTIYYYVYWSWSAFSGYDYDTYWDTYDLVSAQIRYDNGWRWQQMAAQTWNQWGSTTGTVSNNGSSTGNGITLRDDFWNGRIFNLYDHYSSLTGAYNTHQTKVWGWIKPGSTSSNQVKSNFEHNYAEYIWNSSANISGVGLNNFNLSVTYSKVNKNWSRGTPALTITKP